MNNHMEKEDLLYICKGGDWYNNDNVIYFKGNISGKEINFEFCGYSEDEVLSGLGYFIERIIRDFERLDKEARNIIKEKHKDEDTNILKLSDICFDKSECYDCFGMGYYACESKTGKLYLIIKFNDKFQADKDIVYELY